MQPVAPFSVGYRIALVIGIIIATAVACGGDEDPEATATPAQTVAPSATPTLVTEPSPAASPSAPATPTMTATSTPPSSLDGLALVYVDKRRGRGAEVYIADANGDNPRLVTAEPGLSRPLDVMGRTLAAVGGGGVLLVDLLDGGSRLIAEQRIVFDGAFIYPGVFLYSASGSCTQGGGTLYRVEVPDGEPEELLTSDLSLTIAGFDTTSGTVALIPRGCDVGIAGLDVYDAASGALRNSLAVEGCGWAIAIPAQNKAVASWQACTPPSEHTGADATVYDFGFVGPTGHDVTLPDTRPNAAIWLARPGHAEVALGATRDEGTGPGSRRGDGIYMLDLATRQFSRLVEGDGAEQIPIAWSPDGRYLLYAIVEAQGVCRYAYVDADSAQPAPFDINDEITVCGVNGDMAGWTELP